MKKIIALLTCLTSPLFSCPTCIGLPRPLERPFFERKSFLAALKQPTKKLHEKEIPAPAKKSLKAVK